MAWQRWMRAGQADSRRSRHTAPTRVKGRTDGPSRRKVFDADARHAARDRLAWAAPPIAAVTLLGLAAADLANVAPPVEILLAAIAAAALLAIRTEDDTLRKELRRARVTTVDAIDLERSRIQHDLHDSIQQRLISIRIRLEELSDLAPQDDVREVVERLGGELDAALADIRAVTWGSAPRLLELRGLRDSLREALALTPLPVAIEFNARSRYPPEVERCVYFCCLEAVQNILKHAGSKARAWIRVTEWAGWLAFEIEDSGVGFELDRIQPGTGITSLADRVGALGGRLSIDTRPGFGTLVRGDIPLTGGEPADLP
jgi:signal transduction histidine kinase